MLQSGIYESAHYTRIVCAIYERAVENVLPSEKETYSFY